MFFLIISKSYVSALNEDAIAAFERGTALKAHCQKRLEEARMKVEQIKLPEDGAPPSEASAFSLEN